MTVMMLIIIISFWQLKHFICNEEEGFLKIRFYSVVKLMLMGFPLSLNISHMEEDDLENL